MEIFQNNIFRVYNPDHPNHPSKLFGGDASGIRNWDDLKYPVFLTYQKGLFGEFWIPEEIQMGKDMEQFKEKLTEDERRVYGYVTGVLNWLDSMATDIVTLLFMSATDPSLRTVLSLIAGFESMHNVSYEHITSSVMNQNEKKLAFNSIKDIDILNKRNKHIIDKIESLNQMLSKYILDKEKRDFDEQEQQVLFEGIVAYLILEGLYFAGGFVYFHSLARDNKMLETNNIIAMIRTDENQHNEIFGLILQILMNEYPKLNNQENMDWAMEYIREATELEKEWSTWLFQDIDTLSIAEYHNYAEYLSNLIARNAGMNEPFPENTENKAKWIATYGSKKSSESDVSAKADFLQGNAIDYKHEDGDDFDL